MTDQLDMPRQLVAERKRIRLDLLKRYPVGGRTSAQQQAIDYADMKLEEAEFWLMMARHDARCRNDMRKRA